MSLRGASGEYDGRTADGEHVPLPGLPATDPGAGGLWSDLREDPGCHRGGEQGVRAGWPGRAQGAVPLLPAMWNVVVLGGGFAPGVVRRCRWWVRGSGVSAALGVDLRGIETCLGSAA